MQLIYAELLANNPVLRKYETSGKTVNGSNHSPINNYNCSSSNTADFTLHLDDGDIKVHKLVLTSSSSYFRCMLSTDCEEQSVGAVTLPNMMLDTLFIFLKYIYTGIAHLDKDTFLDVWQMADYFQVLPLVKLCCQIAKVNLLPENCLLVYYQADIHQFHDLAWHAMSFAGHHLAVILENVPHHLKDITPSTMQAIIRHPSFLMSISSLLKYFEALKLWCQYDTSRYQHISRMLSIAELCVLANQFPEMAAQLSLHPQATLKKDHRQKDSFDTLFVQTSLMYRQIVITFGGQQSGTILQSGESYTPESQYYHTENNSQLGHPNNWTLGYLSPDTQDAIIYSKHLINVECQMLLPKKANGVGHAPGLSGSPVPEVERIKDKRMSARSYTDIENFSYGIGDVKLDKILSEAFQKRFKSRESFLSTQCGPQWCLNSALVNIDRVIKECKAVMNGAVASFVDSNKLVILGGRNGGGPVRTVQQYCVDSNSWSLLPSLPIAAYGGGAAVINGVLYHVAGATTAGVDAKGGLASSHNAIDGRGNASSQVHNSNSSSRNWDSSTPNTVRYLNNLWCLKPGADHWEALSSLPGDGLCHVAVTVLNDSLVVTGGVTTHSDRGYPSVACVRCWRYEPITDEWTRIGSLRQNRACHGAAVSRNKMYVMGGKSGKTWLSCVERYDPCTDSWVHVPDMLTPRSEFGLTVHNEDIYVVGGFTGHKTTNQVECYSALSQSWQPRPNMRMNRVGPVAATVRVPFWKESFVSPSFWP